jgi:hypothetical protein
VNSVGKESVQDGTNTSQVPVTESQHQTGTVGLLVWPSKNQELVVTGIWQYSPSMRLNVNAVFSVTLHSFQHAFTLCISKT